MSYPAMVVYHTEAEYRQHYEKTYCSGKIFTFDGIEVGFRKSDFDHCFFESSKRDKIKDVFSSKRAERVDWILAALQDPNSDRYVGWDREKKRYDKSRRVALVCGDYVVIIGLRDVSWARFITAYVADTPRSLERIQKSPRWQ